MLFLALKLQLVFGGEEQKAGCTLSKLLVTGQKGCYCRKVS